ncbi:MAG: AarF/UbiB family protein [Desulfobacterales bacterium]
MTDNKGAVKSAASRPPPGRAGGSGGGVHGRELPGQSFPGHGHATSWVIVMLMKNALRIKELLGELKGVPMKIGQMISLHENLFPREVVQVLKSLQQNAPPVPFSDLRAMMEKELGPRLGYIRHIDETPMAAASIGQVHQAAVLVNGAPVALKIQYPGIDTVIRADLKNLKGLLKLLFSMFSRMDMEPVWQELKDRLMEELDYERKPPTSNAWPACTQMTPGLSSPGSLTRSRPGISWAWNWYWGSLPMRHPPTITPRR